MTRLALVLALVTGLVVGGAGTASACSCVPFTKAQLVENATAIFTGTVTGASAPFWPIGTCARSSADAVTYTVAVETVYKGDVAKTVTVRTAASGASCGYEFQAGKRYTVFATGTRDSLETNLCRGNVEGAIAPADYGLGGGTPPR